jgi:hypothetical protein
MSLRGRSAFVALLLGCVVSSPAFAGISPYVRLDYGVGMLDLPSVDQQVQADEDQFFYSGLPVDFDTADKAIGPSGSAGLWLFPGFRVGATWSDTRSKVNNPVELSGFTYADQFFIRMKDVGAEAAFRIPRLGGLTFGGSLAQTKAEMSEQYTLLNVHGEYYETEIATHTGRTYGGFVGFDQTNASGIAGYVRVGYMHRDLGSAPTTLTVTDNGVTTVSAGAPFSFDYSGYYVRAGIGFDWVH